mgnify:CR=1 FL=1
MLDLLASIALQIAPSVLEELIPILGDKLRQKWLSPTSEDNAARVEIKDTEIIEKIKETLQQGDKLVQDDIKNNHEIMEQLIQQVLNEIKTLSAGTSNLEVGSDEIRISQQTQEKDKQFNSQELEVRLEEIKRSLEENIARRLIEIQASTSNNNPQPVMPEPSSPKGRGHEDDEQESLRTNEQSISKPDESNKGDEDKNQGLAPGTKEKNQVSENLEFPMLEKLHKYQEYGDSILRELNSLPQNQSSANNILDNPELQDCLKNLKQGASRTVEFASSPVKIAVMGEFSSGKTLLIGSLIGYADALPVSEIPTTGNVTAIHLLQQDGLKTTEFGDFRVEYLSQPEVQKCLEFMLDQLQKRAQESELPAFPQPTLTTLDENTLHSYEQWFESAWNQTQNLKLRSLLRELVILVRAYISYGADLCGKSLKIDHTTAREGLKLTNTPSVNREFKFEEIPSFAKLPVNENQPTPKLLQNSFSLIRRVNINVKVSKQIWNLRTTQDTAKFVLLDFPGLGAAESGVRDTFVSLQELEEVQTILILLNGSRPGSDSAHEIVSMIEQKRPRQNLKDFILVGVGRFNQLPIESEQKLDKLINSDTNNSLIEETVYQEFSGLKKIIDQAEALTSQKERIVLLDQQMSLADLAKRSNAVTVGSPDFLDKLENQNNSSLQQSKQMREKWQSLSERLLKTDSRSHLGKLLGYFADDGGIGKLRELIFGHVANHSLKQLYDDTEKTAKKLREQQNKLIAILKDNGINIEENPALKELRSNVGKMKSIYNQFKDNLGREPLKDAKGVAISDVIKDEATYQILDWRQWNSLFERAQDGIIKLPPKSEDKKNRFTQRTNPTNNIPTKADDFYSEFDKTVQQLQKFASDCIQKAITNLLNNLSKELAPQIERFKVTLKGDMETEIEQKFGGEQAYTFSVFYGGYNPEEWEKTIMEETFEAEMSIDTANIFPLARKDEKHESGQIFDWAPEYSQINTPIPNQVLLVQRLRDEITASISLHTIEYVSQINKKVDKQISEMLDDLTPELDRLLREEKVLRYIAGDQQEINENDVVSPILSQIASIPLPEISS